LLNRLSIIDLPLAGLKLVERQRLGDVRGFLSRIFCLNELAAAGWTEPVVQINHSLTVLRGTVRGLHFQHPPHAEMKLVSCVRGEVWDVAVDIRSGTKTFLQWHAQRLSADNGHALLIPQGFAHGFQAMTDNAELIYCQSAIYAPETEAAINAADPRLAIAWPLPLAERSPRDSTIPFIDDQFGGVQL
jgi:dTDP-4-dehydrorhamnose 3,5-epimerase